MSAQRTSAADPGSCNQHVNIVRLPGYHFLMRRVAGTTSRAAVVAVAIGAALLGALAGLELGAAPTAGYVTGVALRCGPAINYEIPITVYATQNGRTVASQEVRSAPSAPGHYFLQLPAGMYLISAPGSDLPPRSVTINAGHTVTINFPDWCR